MQYQEKLDLAQMVLGRLKSGETQEDVLTFLTETGLRKWDIDKVMSSVRTMQKEEYAPSILNHMLAGTLAEHLKDFEDLDDDLFEEIQYDLIGKVRGQKSNKARLLYHQGQSKETISKMLVDNIFTQENLESVIGEFTEVKKKKIY